MKIQTLSDLHDEFYSEMNSYLLASVKHSLADVVLLAGDITTLSTMHRLKHLTQPTYYVLGNHEYYHSSWTTTVESYKKYFDEKSNVMVLENESIHIASNVRLIVATLWTSLWFPTEVGREYQGALVTREMADFDLISGISLLDWETRYKKSVKFIENELSKAYDGKTIVMTHHLPSPRSVPEIFKNSPINGGFASDMDWLIEKYSDKINYWVHGHTHGSCRYFIKNTEIICNPRGYPNELNPNFDPNLIIEV